jgi:hypothetical protein
VAQETRTGFDPRQKIGVRALDQVKQSGFNIEQANMLIN